MIYKQRTDEEKKRTRKLIDIGGLVTKAGMGDYPKPFLLGLLYKCKMEIVPKLTRQELDELFESGFRELQKSGRNKVDVKPQEQSKDQGQPKSQVEGPKRKLYFYEKEGFEPWMAALEY
jgi:hypothetical protein